MFRWRIRSAADGEKIQDETIWRQEEEKRLHAMYKLEHQLQVVGYQRIAGVDEAGRGPLAGPVAAAAIIPPGLLLAI